MDQVFKTFRAAYGGLPREVWQLSLVLLVNRSGTMVLPFLALYLADQRGYSPGAVGLSIATYGVGSILGAASGGWLTSRVGALRTQLISLLLAVPLFLLLPIAPGWAGMAAAILALSIGAEMVRPASATATADFCPPELHRKAFALNRLAVNLGMTLGPALGGFLYTVNPTWLFVVDASTCLVAAILAWVFFGARKVVIESDSPSASHARARSPWSDRPFLIYCLLLLMIALVFFQLVTVYPLYLFEQLGFAPWQIGLLFAINTVVIVVFEMLLVHLVSPLNDLRVVAAGSVFICVGFGLTAFVNGYLICALTVLLWTIGEMLAMPLSMAFVSRRTSSGNRGRYMAVYAMVFSASTVLAPILGTMLYELGPRWPWYESFLMAIPIAAGLLALSYHLDRAAPPPGREPVTLDPPSVDDFPPVVTDHCLPVGAVD